MAHTCVSVCRLELPVRQYADIAVDRVSFLMYNNQRNFGGKRKKNLPFLQKKTFHLGRNVFHCSSTSVTVSHSCCLLRYTQFLAWINRDWVNTVELSLAW